MCLKGDVQGAVVQKRFQTHCAVPVHSSFYKAQDIIIDIFF